jgi:hypothetical protein
MLAGMPEDIEHALLVAGWLLQDRLMYTPRLLKDGRHKDWSQKDWAHAADVELQRRLPDDDPLTDGASFDVESSQQESILWGFPVALCFAIADNSVDMTIVYENAVASIAGQLKAMSDRKF